MIKAAIFLAITGMVASSVLPSFIPAYPKVPVVPVGKVPVVPHRLPLVPVPKFPLVPVGKVPIVPNHVPVVPVPKVPAVFPLTKIGYETIPQPYVRDYRIGGYKNLGYVKYPEYLGYNGLAYGAPYYGYGAELLR